MIRVILVAFASVVLYPASLAAADVPVSTQSPPGATIIQEWRTAPSSDGHRMRKLMFATSCESVGSAETMLQGALETSQLVNKTMD